MGGFKRTLRVILIFVLNSGNHYFKDKNKLKKKKKKASTSSPANHFSPELVFCCFSSLK